MPFQPGQSGNPAGRPHGSRNKKSLAAEAALFARAQELVDDLVKRAMRGEPEAMRLCMQRILPAGGGRPVPIELPPVRSGEDAYAAADVIMQALKQGALSAREAVDLLRVVKALARLVGAVKDIERVERRAVAKAAQTLGYEHFFPGPPPDNNYARQVEEMNAEEDEAAALETDEDELPRNPNDLSWWDREQMEAHAAGGQAPPEGDESLQIVADSDDGGRRAKVG